ncbi:MAG: tetraacyldisaccharide 4'-kinase [Acidobacteriota bacterium]
MRSVLGSIYSAAATWRRQWYAGQPSRRSRLAMPVVSVGNLSVGGSGKTPIVGYIARLLLANGERPAILTRGYGRRHRSRGVTVVSDGAVIRAGIDSSGDEPLMLARALPGVAVVVAASRYRAGRVAEQELGATVHVLDDGFQHLQLHRDIDLLALSEDDLADAPLPAGRLREPLAAAAAADAALVSAGYASAVERVGRTAGVAMSFQFTRTLGVPHTIGSAPEPVVVPPESRVFAVAGIARPERFFSDIDSAGWHIVGEMSFRDHHPFTTRDVRRIGAAARAAAAAIILTTEKDAVRFESCERGDLPIAAVPLLVDIEPAATFREWLVARVAAARRDRPDTGTPRRGGAPASAHPSFHAPRAAQ